MEELYHYGVKGMKWGVRKKYYGEHMDRDRVIKKGTTMQNISADGKRDVNTKQPIYTSHTKKDNDRYKGEYGGQLHMMDKKTFKNDLEVKTDVKIPSQQKAVDTFMELYKKDPKGMATSISKVNSELTFFNKVDFIRNYNAKSLEKKYAKKGDDWLKTKGYEYFNRTLMDNKQYSARDDYFTMLSKKGYGAILDTNDANRGVEDPIIFINPKKSLKNVGHKELTYDEIELANARYQYDEAYKKRGIVDTLLWNEYSRAKHQLKEVEKKQGITNSYIRK